ncbi:uncharacterized protein K444DRAFT_647220 [Hyaloscypha bicolor E]|uniref:Clock-controlled protein 6 n=1 Tax=Hyaloscypha bicolor E TaxID=1095630 RepID=A0A2J6SPA2_9HELO|nr:uncharacterized protein K444DRAFT_647220 [Hyaloscypha bicolor E]PMD52553.1 hypothetical protein K444DRAFT_647220 [Hyaloscypha bicolor E]
MQFTSITAIAALATTIAALSANSSSVSIDYVTEVFTAYSTYCPASTELTFNGVTYTVTKSSTLTITNCPCTIIKPVTSLSIMYCNTYAPAVAPVVYSNATTTPKAASVSSTSAKVPVATSSTPSPITTSGGNKLFAMSTVSFASLLGLVTYLL